GKARRYQALLADLQVLDTHHSKGKLDALENRLLECRTELAQIGDTETRLTTEIQQRENDLIEARHAGEQTDSEIADVRAEIERLQSEIGGFRARIDLNRQRAEELNELMARAQAEITAAEAKRAREPAEMDDPE